MTVDMKIDANALKAVIASEIQKQDGQANKCATQMMIEGVNTAQKLVLKDTGNLNDSIPEASSVKRIGPCIYDVTLGNGMDYGTAQENGPQSGKKVWRFRPHIRPAAMIVQVKSSEIIDRVYNG